MSNNINIENKNNYLSNLHADISKSSIEDKEKDLTKSSILNITNERIIFSIREDLDNQEKTYCSPLGLGLILEYYENIERKLNDKYSKCDEYVTLARKAIFEYINNKRIIDVPDSVGKSLLNNRSGVFVSIHKFDELRGCIGTIEATTSCIAEEIIRNAISACVNDYRFSRVTKEELKYLSIDVDVLTKPEKITSSDELDVKKYGVIVTSKGKRGLLLPDLEGVDTVEEQIKIASLKAGITKGEKIELQRFEVIRHK